MVYLDDASLPFDTALCSGTDEGTGSLFCRCHREPPPPPCQCGLPFCTETPDGSGRANRPSIVWAWCSAPLEWCPAQRRVLK